MVDAGISNEAAIGGFELAAGSKPRLWASVSTDNWLHLVECRSLPDQPWLVQQWSRITKS